MASRRTKTKTIPIDPSPSRSRLPLTQDASTRRETRSTTLSISSPPSPTSSERSGRDYYRRLHLVAFAGPLVYTGYLLGSVGGGGLGVDRGQLPAHPDGAATGRGLGDGGEGTGAGEDPRGPAYAKGPVIHEHMGRGTSISLIGERHSGTNWITDHLIDCFGDQLTVEPEFTRFKHWFQFDDPTIRNGSAVVVAMFRDPYDWVEAMREHPHHAHEHIGVRDTLIGMEWRDFVTKPWAGPRGPADREKMKKAKEEGFHIDKWGCLAGYKFDEVIPCSAEDSVTIEGYSSLMYELRNDESHRAYGSVVELRTAKILNFLQVPTFHGVKAFFPERYEALNLRGTADFLRQLEEVTGAKADCEPLAGTGVVKHKDVDPEFTAWMNRYHDWDAEGLIGYVQRDPAPRREAPLELDPASDAKLPQSNAQAH